VESNDPEQVLEFRAALEVVDGEPMIVVAGEVDLAVVDRLWRCIVSVVDTGGPVVLDFSEVSFIDSSGINLLTRAYQQLGARAEAVVVRRPSAQVLRVLEMSGVDGYVTVVPAGGVDGPGEGSGSGPNGSS
jgi:anti-anti-sigma factor